MNEVDAGRDRATPSFQSDLKSVTTVISGIPSVTSKVSSSISSGSTNERARGQERAWR